MTGAEVTKAVCSDALTDVPRHGGPPVKGALDVHRELLELGVPHEVVRLPRVVLSADEVPDVLGLPREQCVAVRMYDVDDSLVAAIVRSGEVPEPSALLAAVDGTSLRPARAEVVNTVTDYAATLVSPLLLPPEVVVVCDASVGHVDVVYAPTGDGGTALGIPTRELLVHSRARVADLHSPVISLVDVDASGADDLTVELLGLNVRSWH